MAELAARYDPLSVEEGLDASWEAAGCYRAESTSDKPPYCITIPPPNVTGSLHMGHALTLTIQDVLIRWKRMCGYNALWLPGTDHAGIATQMVVERELQRQGSSRFDLGREGFLERAWAWKEEYHDRIVGQMRRMGVSVDWSRERFTLDDAYCHAVRTGFVELFREGLIYQDNRLVNWSPGIQTVLSDLEVEHRESQGHLWHMRYPFAGDPGRGIVVATTRPETMLGDTAVAVHPEDPRYADLVGKELELPLAARRIPVVADEAVDPGFGTGAVKVTPAHDFNDFAIGKRHGLPAISIFDASAHLNAEVPERYRGLDRDQAREKVVADLQEAGLLVKIEPHLHAVGHCQRSGVVVEPMLSTQWFVGIRPMAEPAMEAVRDGRIRFVPESWSKTYFNWMENIQDWCISRQLWWGHRIPVWTCRACAEQICEVEDPSLCPSCGGRDLDQDPDVLDTWFSSALWPFATLGWPEETDDLRTFYPNTVMETGFDIIFFWVARMVMAGMKFTGEIPFSTVYLHAMVRDEKGQKMSKTRGNVVDPLAIIDDQGADALRFTLTMLASQGRDIKLNVERVAGYRAFCNKLWNAARFVLMNTRDLDAEGFRAGLSHGGGTHDRWLKSKERALVAEVQGALEGFRFNEAASALYQFAWHGFCDWYLELSKQTLRSEATEPDARRATQARLLRGLDTQLRLLHPFMPHVTERLWQALPDFVRGDAEMLPVAAWPTPTEADPCCAGAMLAQEHVNAVISAVRNIRSERGIAPGARILARVATSDPERLAALRGGQGHIRALCRLSELEVVAAESLAAEAGASFALVEGTHVLVLPPAEDSGLDEERARLDKEIARAEESVGYLERKLGNPRFVERAPAPVVERERQRLREARAELESYRSRLSELG